MNKNLVFKIMLNVNFAIDCNRSLPTSNELQNKSMIIKVDHFFYTLSIFDSCIAVTFNGN